MMKQKKLFKEDFSNTDYEALKKSYEERLENYVIDDIYNFTFDSEESSYEKIKDVNTYEAKKLVIQYCDEQYRRDKSDSYFS